MDKRKHESEDLALTYTSNLYLSTTRKCKEYGIKVEFGFEIEVENFQENDQDFVIGICHREVLLTDLRL